MPDRIQWWRDRVAARAGRALPIDVLDELAAHLADEESAAVRGGAPADEAEAQALAVLRQASFQDLRAQPRARHLPLAGRAPGLVRDLKLALRHLRRSPAFTATAIATLAIGIGANTAIFTLVHAVLLKPLPIAHANQLYKLGDEYRCCPVEAVQGNWSVFPYPFYLDVRDRSGVFAEVAAMDTLRPELSVRRDEGGGVAESFTGEFVTGNYFTTLGVRALAGRLFDETDDRSGAPPVAVVRYGAWRKSGLDATALGRAVSMSGVSVTVVGVTPPDFFGDRLDAHPPDFWVPMALEPTFTRESTLLETPVAGWLYIAGRLRSGVTPTAAQARLTSMLRTYLRVPGHVNHDEDRANIDAQVVRVVPGGGGNNAMRRDYEQGLYLLMAVAASVLLIACANLANLLLVRGAALRTATAVEVAIGASRFQIVRRQLTESIVLSLLGGAAGLVTALVASRAIVALAFRGTPQVPIDTSLSVPVLMFTFVVSLATGVLFGAGPAWLAARLDPVDALRGSARVVGDGGWTQRALVVLQAAMSLVLVTLAALLSQSLRNLDRQQYGFEVDGRLVLQIDPQSAGYTQRSLSALYQRLDERLSGVPGVASASVSLYTAQQADSLWGARIFLEGAKGPFAVGFDRVGPRYFETIGTPLLRGRGINLHDTADAPRIAVVNETFASQFFSNENAIGHHFGKYTPGHASDYTIVGIVADAQYQDASQPVPPMFFVPMPQMVRFEEELLNKIEESSHYARSIEVHVHGDPDAAAPLVRAALADVDPNLAPKTTLSFRELIRIATRQRVLMTRLSDMFGAIALVLAGVGLYGVTAYRVARRRNEIGLRVALGATRGQIASMVVHGACLYAGVGVAIGAPIAALVARGFRSQLFGVSPFNLPILAESAALVCACAVIASVIPARRAAAIAPMDALNDR